MILTKPSRWPLGCWCLECCLRSRGMSSDGGYSGGGSDGNGSGTPQDGGASYNGGENQDNTPGTVYLRTPPHTRCLARQAASVLLLGTDPRLHHRLQDGANDDPSGQQEGFAKIVAYTG